jgi:hypothetical protein
MLAIAREGQVHVFFRRHLCSQRGYHSLARDADYEHGVLAGGGPGEQITRRFEAWLECIRVTAMSGTRGVLTCALSAGPSVLRGFAARRLCGNRNVPAVWRQCHSSALFPHGECVDKGHLGIWLQRPLGDAPSDGMHDLLVGEQKSTQLPRHPEGMYESAPALDR